MANVPDHVDQTRTCLHDHFWDPKRERGYRCDYCQIADADVASAIAFLAYKVDELVACFRGAGLYVTVRK